MMTVVNVSPLGFLPRTTYEFASVTSAGTPEITPVVGLRERPTGSGVLSCM